MFLFISIISQRRNVMLFKKRLFIYLFLERRERREKERERNTNIWLPPACPPHEGPGPQPRYAPQLGIKPVILWLSGQHSIHWDTPAKACLQNTSVIWVKTLSRMQQIKKKKLLKKKGTLVITILVHFIRDTKFCVCWSKIMLFAHSSSWVIRSSY